MRALISAMCSVARGSTVGAKQPSAATSSWNWAAVTFVSSPMAIFSLAARSLILSSTSVMFLA